MYVLLYSLSLSHFRHFVGLLTALSTAILRSLYLSPLLLLQAASGLRADGHTSLCPGVKDSKTSRDLPPLVCLIVLL